VKEAKQFIEWATSKDYIKMIGENEGWVTVPPGTRMSTYHNAAYRNAAPFAKATLDAIETADPQSSLCPAGIRRAGQLPIPS